MDNVLLDTFLEVLLKAAVSVTVALIPIIVGILTRMLVLKMQELSRQKGAISNEQYRLLTSLAQKGILAAEQMLKENSAKQDYAIGFLVDFANDNGITVTNQQAKAIVEGSLRQAKSQLSIGASENGTNDIRSGP